MNKEMLAHMKQATALTRAGRLADATALIQAALGRAGAVTPATSHDDVIEGAFVEIDKQSDISSAAPTTDEPVATHAPQAPHAAPAPHPADAPPSLQKPATRMAAGIRDLLHHWRHREPAAPAGDRADAGEFLSGRYANAAGARAYRLHVPSGTAAQQSLPLVVMLHGCAQSPEDFAAGTQMNRLAETQRCFVLYPAQSGEANQSRCWNWFRREDQARDRGEPSLIAGMTREVIQSYGIDPRRVYIAGLSAGGAMAAVMAVTYPELFAAVGIHSGIASGSAHDLPSALAAMRGMPTAVVAAAGNQRSHATPTIVFHGDKDKTVHPRNGADVIERSAHHAGGPGGAVVSERGAVAGGHAYTRTLHRDAGGRVLLEHWLVHGGGHAWFGGSPQGSYTDARGPDASAEMLRFFLASASAA
jgi:poly(hydroxyalkanoate) depolymerase family esterase